MNTAGTQVGLDFSKPTVSATPKPTKEPSHLDKIERLFRTGHVLTVLRCWEKVGTFELRHYVSILKKQGMDIRVIRKTSKRGRIYGEYIFHGDR